MSYSRSPGWLRAAQVVLGVLTIILSIFALAYPGYTFISVVVILAVVMLFVGFEKIITGIFLPSRSSRGRLATVGLGILVLVLAGIALAFPVASAFVGIIFIGVALLFSGIARIVEGISGEHSGWSKTFLIAVGLLAVILSFPVMASPAFGAAVAGAIIAIALLIIGIQMVAAGILGQKFRNPTDRFMRS